MKGAIDHSRPRIVEVPHREPHPPIVGGMGRRYWNRRGMFPSRRSGWGVPFHGPLEREALTFLEVEPGYGRITARAIAVQWWTGEGLVEHVPTFLVDTTRGPLAVDVAAEAYARLGKGVPLFAAVRAACREAGLRHRLLTDDDTRVSPGLANRELIRAASVRRVPDTLLNAVLDEVRRTDGASPRQISRLRNLPEGSVMAACLHLVWRCWLTVDLGMEIDRNASFRSAE